MITRYNAVHDDAMVAEVDGEWVRWADHYAAMQKALRYISTLSRQLGEYEGREMAKRIVAGLKQKEVP